MVDLRRATRDALAPDGTPVIGRGYEVVDDGEPLDRDRLHPGVLDDVAVVEVIPTTAEQRRALTNRVFGVGRLVQVEPDGDEIVIRDADGVLEGGRLRGEVAEQTAALLEERGDLAVWVCWEWLQPEGRSGIDIALTGAELAPTASPPAEAAAPGVPRRWLVIGAVVVVLIVVFVSCV